MPLAPLTEDQSSTTTGFSEWNFDNRLISGVQSSNFASSKSVLISAGPTEFSGIDGDNQPIPIGLVQDFNMQQQNQVQEIFEVGSRGKYFLQGRPSRQATLSRLVVHGPSLLRALYSSSPDGAYADATAGAEGDAAKEEGSMMYINLASRFFENPCGLLIRVESMSTGDSQSNTVGAATEVIGSFYLEECYVRAHALSISANQTVIGENVTLSFNNVVPVA